MKIGIIGSGFSGLSAAAFLAKKGHDVHVFEKNETLGGRARSFIVNGFTFDMGPSWYWMPEVFDQFFEAFNKKTSDFYDLVRLDPSYKVVFGQNDEVDIPADYQSLRKLFESIEEGSAAKLDQFLAEAEYKYKVGMGEFVWKPSLSIFEFADIRILKSLFKLDMFSSIAKQIRNSFSNPKLQQILEFPVLFLGATPQNTPALYSLMNYADIKLGTWYPIGGMYKIIEGMVSICKGQGVTFHTSSKVDKILLQSGSNQLKVNDSLITFDKIISSADYHHTESNLLNSDARNYNQSYWDKRVMAPSSLLFYLGLDIKLQGFEHHNLFFDEDFNIHAEEIYTNPKWPTKPLFYACVPSKTDSTVAPPNMENLFLLIPIAPNLKDGEEFRNKYFNVVCDRILKLKGIDIRDHIVFQKSFCIDDFKSEYNSFKGNAYGLANTLFQTAFLKPRMKSKKSNDLYYTGQLTTPGPGVPPSIISGQVVADLISNP